MIPGFLKGAKWISQQPSVVSCVPEPLRIGYCNPKHFPQILVGEPHLEYLDPLGFSGV